MGLEPRGPEEESKELIQEWCHLNACTRGPEQVHALPQTETSGISRVPCWALKTEGHREGRMEQMVAVSLGLLVLIQGHFPFP